MPIEWWPVANLDRLNANKPRRLNSADLRRVLKRFQLQPPDKDYVE